MELSLESSPQKSRGAEEALTEGGGQKWAQAPQGRLPDKTSDSGVVGSTRSKQDFPSGSSGPGASSVGWVPGHGAPKHLPGRLAEPVAD